MMDYAQGMLNYARGKHGWTAIEMWIWLLIGVVILLVVVIVKLVKKK
jgi:competence protein ComGC